MDINYHDIIEQFLEAMRAAGISGATELVADGKLHRFTVDGDKPNSDNGWYTLHADGIPAGSFGSWKTGLKETWSIKLDRKLTNRERKELEAKINEQRKKREEEERRVFDQASKRAQEIWSRAKPATDHPYLAKKQIKAHGVRVDDRSLIVPLYNSDRKLTSLQFITEDQKLYLPGGEKSGSYYSISKSKPTDDTPVLICEGFATGASLHEATELPVVVAFDTSNLAPVGRAIREKFTRNKIILCADNDRWTTRKIKQPDGTTIDEPFNPGMHYANEAAKLIDGSVCFPAFPADDPERRTDFNDLRDPAAIKVIIDAALMPVSLLPVPTSPDSSIQNRPYGFIHVVTDWPFTKGKDQKPVTNIENIWHLLQLNNISVNYDVIKKDLRINIPGENYLIDTEKNDKLSRIVSVGVTAGLTDKKSIQDFVGHIGSQNPVNPVAEWIESKPWDGVNRLNEFLATIEAVDEHQPEKLKLKNTLILKWLLSAIAAAYRPNGVSAHGVLVFTGDQYAGKTNWFKNLVPQDLRLTKDGMILRPDDKDSVYQIVSNWIVELGEIDATFRKSDIAQLKAFITKDEDVLRLPYARSTSNFARRTVFFASVNDRDYLSDPTGNRRFWTIEVAKINHTHGIDMQQVWAEVLLLFKQGMSYFLDHEEIGQLNEHNKDYEVMSPVEELLETKYDWSSSFGYSVRNLTATEIAIELGLKNPTQRDIRLIARSLRRKKIETVRAKGKTLYRIPSIKTDAQDNSSWYQR